MRVYYEHLPWRRTAAAKGGECVVVGERVVGGVKKRKELLTICMHLHLKLKITLNELKLNFFTALILLFSVFCLFLFVFFVFKRYQFLLFFIFFCSFSWACNTFTFYRSFKQRGLSQSPNAMEVHNASIIKKSCSTTIFFFFFNESSNFPPLGL